MDLWSYLNSALSEEPEEIRLPLGRTESTVDRQGRSINKRDRNQPGMQSIFRRPPMRDIKYLRVVGPLASQVA